MVNRALAVTGSTPTPDPAPGTGMMLTAVAVSGYRSLRDVVVPLHGLDVVTGANGSGKSSLYRALRLLAGCGRGDVVGTLAREGGLQSALWAGRRPWAGPGARGMPCRARRARGRSACGSVSPPTTSATSSTSVCRSSVGQPREVRLGLPARPGDQARGGVGGAGHAARVGARAPPLGARRDPAPVGADDGWDDAWGGDDEWESDPEPLAAARGARRRDGAGPAAGGRRGWVELTRSLRLGEHADRARRPGAGARAHPGAADDPGLALLRLLPGRRGGARPAGARRHAHAGALRRRARPRGRPPDDPRARPVGARPRGRRRLRRRDPRGDGRGRALRRRTCTSPACCARSRAPSCPTAPCATCCSSPPCSPSTRRRCSSLNEPETSLHPDLLPPLARLIRAAAERSQVMVVSHSEALIRGARGRHRRRGRRGGTRFPGATGVTLVKDLGETFVQGQGLLTTPQWNWGTRR